MPPYSSCLLPGGGTGEEQRNGDRERPGGSQKTIGEVTHTTRHGRLGAPAEWTTCSPEEARGGDRQQNIAPSTPARRLIKPRSPVRYQEPGTISRPPPRSKTISARGRAGEGFLEQRPERGNPTPSPPFKDQPRSGEETRPHVSPWIAGGPNHATALPEVQLVTND